MKSPKKYGVNNRMYMPSPAKCGTKPNVLSENLKKTKSDTQKKSFVGTYFLKPAGHRNKAEEKWSRKSINFSDLPQKLKVLLPPVSIKSPLKSNSKANKSTSSIGPKTYASHSKTLMPLLILTPKKEFNALSLEPNSLSKLQIRNFTEPLGPPINFSITVTNGEKFGSNSKDIMNVESLDLRSTVDDDVENGYDDDDFNDTVAFESSMHATKEDKNSRVDWSSAFLDEEDVGTVLDDIEKKSVDWEGFDVGWYGSEEVSSLPLSARTDCEDINPSIRLRSSRRNSRPVSRILGSTGSNPTSRSSSPHKLMPYFGPHGSPHQPHIAASPSKISVITTKKSNNSGSKVRIMKRTSKEV
jgi:hypothetical protein